MVGAPFSWPVVSQLGTAFTPRPIRAAGRARGRYDARTGLMGRLGILREMVERTRARCRKCAAWIVSASICSIEDIERSLRVEGESRMCEVRVRAKAVEETLGDSCVLLDCPVVGGVHALADGLVLRLVIRDAGSRAENVVTSKRTEFIRSVRRVG